jgi:hypothetical protein
LRERAVEEEGGNCILGSREMSLEVRASMAAECSAGVRGILEGLVVARVLETRARCVDWEAAEMERRSVRMRSWVEEGRGRQDLWTRAVGMWRVVGVRRARMRVELFGTEVAVGWERERDREGAMMGRGQICTQCYYMKRWCGKSLVAAAKASREIDDVPFCPKLRAAETRSSAMAGLGYPRARRSQ